MAEDETGRTQTDGAKADHTLTASVTEPEAGDAGAGAKERVGNRYRIIGEQGRGGMGVVSRAEDTELKRVVALKELQADSEAARRRFEREALLTAGLEHPGIVPIYDFTEWRDGTPFYTMKLISGRSLRDVMKVARTGADRLALLPNAIAVCDAVAYAHSKGVVHRDLKPSNVVVGEFGEVMVIDWGLGKRVGEPDADSDAGGEDGPGSKTRTGALLGTPMYMAPEQARGASAVDQRADVYSLGAILYHLIAGRPPFDSSTIRQRRQQGEKVQPPALASLDQPAPRDLVAIVTRAMAHEANARYRDAGELASELRRFQAGQLVAARSYSSLELVVRWLARHKLQLAALAMLVAFGVGIWQVWRAARVEPACETAEQRIAEVWGPNQQTALRDAWSGFGIPLATRTLDRLTPRVDAYRREWTTQHQQACRATFDTGEQTRETLSLRLDCLEDRRRELRAVLMVLSDGSDAAVVDNAIDVFSDIAPLSSCADIERLANAVPVPAGAEQRQRAAAAAESLAVVRALRGGGRIAEARTELDGLLASIEGMDYPPVAVAAALEDVTLLGAEGEHEASFDKARALREPAARAGLDRELALAWARMVQGLTELARYDDALALKEASFLAALRSGATDALVEHHGNAGSLHARRGEYELAEAELERSVEIQTAQDPSSHLIARALYGLGDAKRKQGKRKEAFADLERALRLLTASLGESHPEVGRAHNNLGNWYRAGNEFDEALVQYEAALRVKEGALGAEHPSLAGTLMNIGLIQLAKLQSESAEKTFTRAVLLFEEHFGEMHRGVAVGLANLGLVYAQLGDFDKAFEFHERSLSIKEKTLPPEHPSLAFSYEGLGDAAREAGLFERAEREYERAASQFAKSQPPAGPSRLAVRRSLARVALWRGQYRAAQEQYRRLLADETEPQRARVVHLELGESLLAHGKLDLAREHLMAAKRITEPLGPEEYALENVGLGELAERQGDCVEAERLIDEALGVFEQDVEARRAVARDEARALLVKARCARRRGDAAAALRVAQRSLKRYETRREIPGYWATFGSQVRQFIADNE